MIPNFRLLAQVAVAAILAVPSAAAARTNDGLSTSPIVRSGAPLVRVAQAEATDLVVRLDRLEEQIRRLTGAIEQLQYRNQQLEQQVRRIEGGTAEYRPQDPGISPGAGMMNANPRAAAVGQPAVQSPPPPVTQSPDQSAVGADESAAPAMPPPQPGQRRAEVFDPNLNPNAPGAPRPLGQIVTGASPGYAHAEPSPPAPGVGAPGGRSAGAPLELSSVSEPPSEPTVIPAPASAGAAGPQRYYPRAAGAQQMVMAPTSTPKDEYDLAYGYVLRKDYALAEESFRAFVKRFPNDRLAPEATYWLGESLFQRQKYRDAAESFLTVSTKFESSSKAPESLLRLGQSLAALGEKDAACATFGQVGRKYPKAGASLRQAAEREQKHDGC